ncbi:hypothetical protein SATMO3_44810 [Sporomusa aerivorans]
MLVKNIITNGSHKDFIKLVQCLDTELHSRYGQLQQEYDKHNTLENIQDVVLLYQDGIPVACGAFKKYDSNTVELKRIFVQPRHRGQGLAKQLIQYLEALAAEQNYTWAVLETGIKQPEAIHLYSSRGYEIINNYGPYSENENSVCMKKALSQQRR